MVHESDCEQILNYLLLIENNSENSSNLTLAGPEGSPEKKNKQPMIIKICRFYAPASSFRCFLYSKRKPFNFKLPNPFRVVVMVNNT